MKKKVEIVTHGNTWVDTSVPTVCPECGSLNVEEHTYNNSKWRGPFYINYSRKIYSCKDCNCSFKTSKDKKGIKRVEAGELSGIIALCSFIIFIILLIISFIFWNDENSLLLTIAIIVNFSIIFVSSLVWLITV